MAMNKDFTNYLKNYKLLTEDYKIDIHEFDGKFMEMLYVFPTDKLVDNLNLLVTEGYNLHHKANASLCRVILAEPEVLAHAINSKIESGTKSLRGLKTVEDRINEEELAEMNDGPDGTFGGR